MCVCVWVVIEWVVLGFVVHGLRGWVGYVSMWCLDSLSGWQVHAGPSRGKQCAGARPFSGPPAPPFPTLVIYVDDSFALYMYL